MKIQFFGAAREVTGSCTLLDTGKTRVLVDCGLFQGGHDNAAKNWVRFGFDPRSIDAVILTHGHIDHIGRYPLLVKAGFRGRAFVTHPTRQLTKFMWLDAAKVMKMEGKKHGLPPLYELNDVWPAFDSLHGVEYGTRVTVAPDFHFTLREAGHVFGSSFVEIEAAGRQLVFSGDLGNDGAPILRDTAAIAMRTPDVIVTESTYGDRKHENVKRRTTLLRQAITETVKRGGTLIIPAFSLERTQELLYELNGLVENSQLPRVKMFLDSPLAINLLPIYRRFPEYYDAEARSLARRDDFFDFPGLTVTRRDKDSRLIPMVPPPKVIIAGSGMMNGGRVQRHLLDYLGDPNSMVLVIGYQAAGTLGRQIVEGEKRVIVERQPVTIRARVREIHGYSAHADADKMLRWASTAKPKRVLLNHGELTAQTVLAGRFKTEHGLDAYNPEFGEEIEV